MSGQDDELTQSERYVLEWLNKEDFSRYGECKGKDLDRLVSLGLAVVHEDELEGDRNWATVSVTDAGRSALEQKP
ncbi:hypothetical protein J2J97_32100 (plasmid) [Rhizobium bangladeshense]|uniref:hypothetical protein n=1 Tax=Rhizobium bangladeshense TaxID=1138189 RepID=UPI001A98FD8E|nr:hypothetical protein [Rhizobium bangladeshense]QSY98549.1 hypothetical protein J2J97_32100 [Rhizobium bangladeshense]